MNCKICNYKDTDSTLGICESCQNIEMTSETFIMNPSEFEGENSGLKKDLKQRARKMFDKEFTACGEGLFVSSEDGDIFEGEEIKTFIDNVIDLATKEERERISNNIGSLRQWLNEKDKDTLVTSENIKTFLEI